MNSVSLLPLLATIAYAPLVAILIARRPWNRQQTLLLFYLIAAIVWSLNTFLLRSDFFAEYKLLLFKIVLFGLPWTAVQLYHLAVCYSNYKSTLGIKTGYILLGIFISLIILGYIPENVTFLNGTIIPSFNWWFYALSILFFILPISLIYGLIKQYRRSAVLAEQNMLIYLVLSQSLMIIGAIIGLTPVGAKFPISHFANLLNACILTYLIVKQEPTSATFVLRRGFAWIGLFVSGSLIYLTLRGLVDITIGISLDTPILAIGIIATLMVSLALFHLHDPFINGIDRLFNRRTYVCKARLLEFARSGIANTFGLKEMISGLLPQMIRMLNCQRAYILFPNVASGDFVATLIEPLSTATPTFTIRSDSPIIEWLGRENKYLVIKNIFNSPEFLGLWKKEKKELERLQIGFLFPMISRGKLIAILALSKKQSDKYSFEDMSFITNIIGQVSANLEKQYLQEQIEKQQQQLYLLSKLSGVMTSSLNIQEVYDAFIHELKQVMGFDIAAITFIEGDELVFYLMTGDADLTWKTGEKIQLSGTATEWATGHKKTICEPDLVKGSMFWTGDVYAKRGIRSIVYAPLISKSEGIGSLIVGSCNPNAFNQEQIDLLDRLASQISTAIANAQLYSKAEQRARVDELTGLFNRRHFDETLNNELNRHARYGSIASVAFIDVDNFKSFNDKFGHPSGDKLLIRIGRIIAGSIRNVDLAFRYGGDEFAVIMPTTSSNNALIVAEKICHRIANETTCSQNGITVSIGLASCPNDGLTVDDIVNASDQGLYYAKRTGGNRVCVLSKILPLFTDSPKTISAHEKETMNVIYALASTIEAKDVYTYGHSRKVRQYAVALAESLGLKQDRVTIIGHAALLHDIGKIGIGDEILNKSSALNDHDWEIVKSHPQLSKAIVAHVPSLTACLPAILHHHERWDGTGYPAGLKDESIPLEARILAIADAFDAMTSLRPYHIPLNCEEAIDELKRTAGSHFDPKLIEAFLPIAANLSSMSINIAEENPPHYVDLTTTK